MTDVSNNTTESDGCAEVITGTIKGDRVCIACGFNLCGQRIVREPKYNLLIARCPECGQAAALQEYPLLGRWADRWAATLAGLWLLLFIVLTVGCGMTIFGLSIGTTEISGDAVEHVIRDAFNEWDSANNSNAQSVSRWTPIDQDWWESVDHASFVEDSGGVPMIIWRSSQTTWVGLLFAMITFGSVGSIALLGVERRRLVMAAVFPLVVATMVSALFVRANIVTAGSNSLSASELGRMLIWHWTIPMTIILGGVFLIFGMLLGRPLARLMARTVLPNRFVQALAVLWTSEGLEPPKPGR